MVTIMGQGGPWAYLEVAGYSLEVTAVDGFESLSLPFRFDFSGVLGEQRPGLCSPEAMIGCSARLRWGNGEWLPRHIAGLVTDWMLGDLTPSGVRRFSGAIRPRGCQLDWNSTTKLFSRVEISELIGHILGKADYPSQCLEWRLMSSVPPRPYVLQAAESDYALMQRILAREGIYYAWLDGEEERLRFADSSVAFADQLLHPDSHNNRLAVAPLGQAAELCAYGLAGFRLSRRLIEAPQPLIRRAFRYTEASVDVDRLERVQAERTAGLAHRLYAWGPCAALRAGMRITIGGLRATAGEYIDLDENGYLVISARHRLRRHGEEEYHKVEIEAMPETLGTQVLRYRPPQPAKRPLPIAISAQVVDGLGGNGYADSDLAGRARAQAGGDGDGSGLPSLEPVQRLHHYVGTGVSRAGWFTPLAGGNRVVVACFDHDPDLPVILGILPQAGDGQLSATSKGRDGGLHTRAGQGLTVNGAGGMEANGSGLALHGPGQNNLLAFDLARSGASSSLRLVCKQGRMAFVSYADLHEYCVGERREEIAAHENLEVKTGNAYLSSKASIDMRVGADIRGGARGDALCLSGRDVSLATGKRLSLMADQGLRFTAAGAGGNVRVNQGGLNIHAQGSIEVTSRKGQVKIANSSNSAGISISFDGAVRIWAEKISLTAEQSLLFKGDVDNISPPVNPRN